MPTCPECSGPAIKWDARRVKCKSPDCGVTRTLNPKKVVRSAPECVCPHCNRRGVPAKGVGSRGRAGCPHCGKAFRPDQHLVKAQAAGSVFLFTSAVNDSPVHRKALATIKVWQGDRGGQLLVAPLRYKNPTSQQEGKHEYRWDPLLAPYLFDGRMQVCKGLQFLADIKTQPTAVRPLSGLDTITGVECGIFPHTKYELDTVATRGGDLPKILQTTGCITKAVYSDTKAGKKGEFHHTMGAVLVEVEPSGIFHMRFIKFARDGSFIDLDKKYTPEGVKPAPRALAIRMGDVHAVERDEAAFRAAQRQIDRLRPYHVILDDVLDFGTASHHNGWFEKLLRRHQGRDDVAAELKETCWVIDQFHRPGQKVTLVSSNHHNHLLKWLADSRNGEDVQNAALYHSLKSKVITESLKKGDLVNPFELAAQELLQHPARFISDRDSFVVGGIENCYHGHDGPNGARGNARAFAKIGAKVNLGHSHIAHVFDGAWQGGTMSRLDAAYLRGPSGWIHCNIITYASGARTLCFVINGRFAADDVE